MSPKKFIKLILIIISGIGLSFLLTKEVQAKDAERLLIEIWDENQGKYLPLEGKPIFNVSNFLPGKIESKKIRVTNNTNETQTVASKVIRFDRGCNISNDNKEYCLADRLILTITPLKNFSPSYSGSLTEFYNAGEIVLSEIKSGGKAEYNFSVYFDKDAEKEYQDLTTSFDIEIGFLGKKSAKGVGKITLTHSITTFNSATLGWTTDIPSFCRVVYDEVSHPVLGNPPNYGYAFSTKPTDVKKDSHQIQLSGLKPDTQYFFRIICWASPEKISQEYTFKTKPLPTITSQVKAQTKVTSQKFQVSQDEKETGEKITKKGETTKGEVQQKTQKEKKEREEKEEKEEERKPEGKEKSKKSFYLRGLLAAIRNLPLNLKIILLALLVIIIILIILWAKREKKEKEKHYNNIKGLENKKTQ